ncbi:hypothetical protein COW53_03045, partial [bacterium CG17_big_fil_post_rev_8_21_14_2_50_64_8]
MTRTTVISAVLLALFLLSTAAWADIWYRDQDSDGWGDPSVFIDSPTQPGGYVAHSGDCDDMNGQVYPGATEIPGDGIDSDCDMTELCFADQDDDGWTTAGTVQSPDMSCSGSGESWTMSSPLDCDDTMPSVNPSAVEVWYDSIDSDCDGANDFDMDHDGYVAEGYDAFTGGTAPGTGDCDDTEPSIHPGAVEICGDQIDNNCDLQVDEDCAVFQITGVTDVGNDQGGQVRLAWNRIIDDAPGVGDDIVRYDVYRRIDANKAGEGDKTLPPGDWDFLLQVPASGEDTYHSVIPSLCDSTDAGVCWSVYFIRARTTSTYLFHDTEPDSGYSIDNLAPAAPMNLFAAYAPDGVALTWDQSEDADFDYFRVYRSTDPDFTPTESLLIHATTGTSWTDLVTDSWHWHYKLTAVDFAGNESPAGSVQQASGANPPAAGGILALHSNVPNPFNPTTTITFELPGERNVRLEVFAVDGRRVATLLDARCSAGQHAITWDGRSYTGRR